MKLLLTASLLFCFASLVWVGCQPSKPLEEFETLTVQQETLPCDHLSIEDLNLGSNFRGTYSKKIEDGIPRFVASGHQAVYDFTYTVSPADCKGICGLAIRFKPAEGAPTFDPSAIGPPEVTLSNTISENTMNSSEIIWEYPLLRLLMVYPNYPNTYEVVFGNGNGDLLDIDWVQVAEGGLCVLDIVNEDADPVYIPPNK